MLVSHGAVGPATTIGVGSRGGSHESVSSARGPAVEFLVARVARRARRDVVDGRLHRDRPGATIATATAAAHAADAGRGAAGAGNLGAAIAAGEQRLGDVGAIGAEHRDLAALVLGADHDLGVDRDLVVAHDDQPGDARQLADD